MIARRMVLLAAGPLVLVVGVAAAQVRRNPPPRAPLPPTLPVPAAPGPVSIAAVTRVDLSCADDVAETRFCDASGACATSRSPCFPYACDAAAHTCAAACGNGCALGAECEAGRCLPERQVPRCDGSASVSPAGARRDCRPLRCDAETGLCLGACVSDADCTTGLSCLMSTCVQRPSDEP